jgi:hypothetical protein
MFLLKPLIPLDFSVPAANKLAIETERGSLRVALIVADIRPT